MRRQKRIIVQLVALAERVGVAHGKVDNKKAALRRGLEPNGVQVPLWVHIRVTGIEACSVVLDGGALRRYRLRHAR